MSKGRARTAWRICAIIVTYHPDEGVCDRVLSIARQVEGLVIVDNASASSIVGRMMATTTNSPCHVIRNPANLGVATALNQGIEYARAHGYTHALLFDQDTQPFDHLVTAMRQIAARRDDADRVAVVGVNLVDAATDKPWFAFDSRTGDASEVDTVITSGSLVSLPIACELGPFRDDFFIDHVDEEYCLRARSRGYKVLITHEPLARHAIGAPRFRKILWRKFGTSNHSPIRRYYMTRNHIILAKAYAFREPRWVIRSLYLRFKGFLLMLVLDDHRLAKLRLMGAGFRDGIAGRTGELPSGRNGTGG